MLSLRPIGWPVILPDVTDSTPASAPNSVRLALPAEAATLAELQRRGWAEQGDVGERMLASIDLRQMAQVWQRAINRPPLATFRVLVAVDEGGEPIAFATTEPDDSPDAVGGRDGQISEFVVDPPARRHGHGSRLLNACVDTLRADGFTRAVWWLPSTHDGLRRFLVDAGWGPDGAHREIGDEELRVKQIRLHTDIS